MLSPGVGSVALIMLSGILYMAAMLFYLRALQSEEASVVAPFFQAGPLFGYVLAYLVLGETLSPTPDGGRRHDHRRHLDRLAPARRGRAQRGSSCAWRR